MSVWNHIDQDEFELESLEQSLSADFDGEEDGNTADWDKDPILEQAIHYAQDQKYQPGMSKDKKSCEKEGCNAGGGQVRSLSQEKGCQVKVVMDPNEQQRSVVPHWSHFGIFWHDEDMEESCRKVLLIFDIIRRDFVQTVHTGAAHWV